MDEETKLTPKQKRFCEYYVKTLNGRNSAIKAGYAEGSAHVQASKLLSDPKIQENISRLTSKYEQEQEFGKDTVVGWLFDIARPTSRQAISNRLKAIDQLAKMHGWNLDVKQINSNVTHKYDELEKMTEGKTPEEIEQLIQQYMDGSETVN